MTDDKGVQGLCSMEYLGDDNNDDDDVCALVPCINAIILCVLLPSLCS